MSIGEDLIMHHLDWHLSQSEPGSMLHHLSALRAPADAVSPFGGVDPAQLGTYMYVVVPDGDTPAEDMIARVVMAATVEAHRDGHVIHFAALSQEMWWVSADEDNEDSRLGRRLLAEGRPLSEHPNSAEVTVIYAACRDGRRWRGRRWLTGPQAGQTQEAELLVGSPRRGESHGVSSERLVRGMVGLH